MARYVDIGRETKDMDFAIQRLSNEINDLQKTFNDIVRVAVEDGFVFMNPKEFLLLSSSKGPLFEPSLTVNCYPIEFIFAEKLETAIFRGAENSRMKDFHDLYTMASSEKMLNEKDIAHAIRLVFDHRNTPIRLPMQFEVFALEALQQYWRRYRYSTVLARVLPEQIQEVIAVINQCITA